MNIVNVGYDSTNYWVLADKSPRLLIDVGFAGTMAKLQSQCKRMGVELGAIKYVLATHYHPDHAGLTQELVGMGKRLVIVDVQIGEIEALREHPRAEFRYTGFEIADQVVVSIEGSRGVMKGLGIGGEIIATPGHSDDSVSLVLDEGIAFTGDLTHPMAIPEDGATLRESWAKLRAAGVRMVYPGHGPVWQLR